MDTLAEVIRSSLGCAGLHIERLHMHCHFVVVVAYLLEANQVT